MGSTAKRISVTALGALALLFVGVAGLAQEDVASAIVDSPASGFVILVSDRVDVSSLDPEGGSQIADAWIKSFSDGTNGVSVLATQFADRDGLRAGLAGAMSQIAPHDRRLVEGHDGVVAGPITQGGLDAELAVYGEGTISFAVAVVGPDRMPVLAETLDNQIAHSAGERFDLHVDENERYLADQEADDAATLQIVAGAVIVLVVATAGVWIVVRRRRGTATG